MKKQKEKVEYKKLIFDRCPINSSAIDYVACRDCPHSSTIYVSKVKGKQYRLTVKCLYHLTFEKPKKIVLEEKK